MWPSLAPSRLSSSLYDDDMSNQPAYWQSISSQKPKLVCDFIPPLDVFQIVRNTTHHDWLDFWLHPPLHRLYLAARSCGLKTWHSTLFTAPHGLSWHRIFYFLFYDENMFSIQLEMCFWDDDMFELLLLLLLWIKLFLFNLNLII